MNRQQQAVIKKAIEQKKARENIDFILGLIPPCNTSENGLTDTGFTGNGTQPLEQVEQA